MGEGTTKSSDSSKKIEKMKEVGVEYQDEEAIRKRLMDVGIGKIRTVGAFFSTQLENIKGKASEYIQVSDEEVLDAPSKKFLPLLINNFASVRLNDPKNKKKTTSKSKDEDKEKEDKTEKTGVKKVKKVKKVERTNEIGKNDVESSTPGVKKKVVKKSSNEKSRDE